MLTRVTTHHKRIFIGLILYSLIVGGVGRGLATGVSAASPAASPLVNATLRDHDLQVIGSRFVPGSEVTIAVIDIRTWRLLSTGWASAQREMTLDPHCRRYDELCQVTNQAAGTFEFHAHLTRSPRAANLLVLYQGSDRVARLSSVMAAEAKSSAGGSPPRYRLPF